MNEELKNKLRDAISEDSLQSEWETIAADLEKYSDDLSWVKAIRDECSAAIRRASNEEPLISRLLEFKMRQATFQIIHKRDGQRAERSAIRAKLLEALYNCIDTHLPEDFKEKINTEIQSTLGIQIDSKTTPVETAVLTDSTNYQISDKAALDESQWDDVILIEGKTVTILGHRKMIIKQDPK